MSLFGFQRRDPHVGVLLLSIYGVTQKAANLEWGPRQERAVQLLQAAEEAAVTGP